MKKSTYFEVSLGTSNAAQVLEKIKNNEVYDPKDEWRLKNTLNIIPYCERAFDLYKMLEDYNKKDIGRVYWKLIWDSRDNKDKYWQVRTLAKIRKIKLTIEKIIEEKRVSRGSITKAGNFFTHLSREICKITPSHGEGYRDIA